MSIPRKHIPEDAADLDPTDVIPAYETNPAAVERLAKMLEEVADEEALEESEQESDVEDLIDLRIDSSQ